MQSDFEEEDFEDKVFGSARQLFALPVIINGNKTDVTFNLCGNGSSGAYYAVNLVRNGSCVNSYTMARQGSKADNTITWKFEEDHVPRELKARESEFSKAISNNGKFL